MLEFTIQKKIELSKETIISVIENTCDEWGIYAIIGNNIKIYNYDEVYSIEFWIKGEIVGDKITWTIEHQYNIEESASFGDNELQEIITKVNNVDRQLIHLLDLKTNPYIK